MYDASRHPKLPGPANCCGSCEGQPRTKAELAALRGLARSTLSSRVDLLISAGLVVPAGDGVSSADGDSRPFPEQRRLNPESAYTGVPCWGREFECTRGG